MNAKREATRLRNKASRHLIRATELLIAADAIDPQVSNPHRSAICDTCGTEYSYEAGYRAGYLCESCDERGVTNYLAWKGVPTAASPASQDAERDIATCDTCGLRITDGAANDGSPFGATKKVTLGGHDYIATCTGQFRFPDEPLKTTDGRSLGVTMDELAASQACLDEAAEHWMGLDQCELSDRDLDIASTYRGGRTG
jgi:hypothetical protein